MGRSGNLNVERRRQAQNLSTRVPPVLAAAASARREKVRAQIAETEAASLAIPPWQLLASGCATLFLAFVITMYLHVGLPAPKSTTAHNADFSEERVRQTVLHLSEAIGPRPSGSAAAGDAVRYIIQEASRIQDVAMVGCRVTVETQTASGGLTETVFGTNEQVYSYTNITNVIVRISFGKHRDNAAVLINSHYDTKDASPGASDDGIPVGIALELMRNLVSGERMFNQAIFLFNDAEEVGLMGAHAFSTGFLGTEKLNITTVAFMNLEAAGAGGKETLFQVGPHATGLLMNAYGKVPYPHGNSIGSDVFRFVPSDTDFRIFRDYGNLSGIDMAYSANGYVYHTPRDQLDIVTPGSIQHFGENALAFARALLEREHLLFDAHFEDPKQTSKIVYFDIFGMYFVWFPYFSAALIIIGIVVLAVILFAVEHWKGGMVRRSDPTTISQVIVMAAGSILSIASAVLTALAVSYVLTNVFLLPMSWFSSPLVAFFLFGIPALAGIMAVQDAVRILLINSDTLLRAYSLSSKASDSATSSMASHDSILLGLTLEHASVWGGPIFVNAVLALASLVFNLQVTYYFAIGLGFSVGLRVLMVLSVQVEYAVQKRGGLAILGVGLGAPGKKSDDDDSKKEPSTVPMGSVSYADVLSLLAMNVLPVAAMSIYMFTQFIELIVPLTGRLGYNVSGDNIVAVLMALAMYFIVLPFLPIYNRANRGYALWVFFAVGLLICVVPFACEPFGKWTPKRVYVQLMDDSRLSVGLLDQRRQDVFVPTAQFTVRGHGGLDLLPLTPFSYRIQTFSRPVVIPPDILSHSKIPSGGLVRVSENLFKLRVDAVEKSAWTTVSIIVVGTEILEWTLPTHVPRGSLAAIPVRHIGSRLLEFEFTMKSPGDLIGVHVDVGVMQVEDVEEDVIDFLSTAQTPEWAAIIPSKGYAFSLFWNPELLFPLL
eukprot:ANDGO_06634.mRNA.1 Putative endoplasmic reticulum metallopeptidase 1-B